MPRAWFPFLFLLLAPGARAELCDPHVRAGEHCHALLKDLRPSQMGVGMKEVEKDREAIHALRKNKSALKKFLKRRRISVVVGPGGRIHVVDGHHEALAMEREGLSKAYLDVKANYSHLSESEFWEKMKANHWVWLEDVNGKAVLPAQLPAHLDELGDDLYRSLAWAVRESKGFADKNIPFAEFEWGKYFRQHISPEEVRDHFDEAVKKATALAVDGAAKKLPGFQAVKPPERPEFLNACELRYEKIK